MFVTSDNLYLKGGPLNKSLFSLMSNATLSFGLPSRNLEYFELDKCNVYLETWKLLFLSVAVLHRISTYTLNFVIVDMKQLC